MLLLPVTNLQNLDRIRHNQGFPNSSWKMADAGFSVTNLGNLDRIRHDQDFPKFVTENGWLNMVDRSDLDLIWTCLILSRFCKFVTEEKKKKKKKGSTKRISKGLDKTQKNLMAYPSWVWTWVRWNVVTDTKQIVQPLSYDDSHGREGHWHIFDPRVQLDSSCSWPCLESCRLFQAQNGSINGRNCR